MKRMFSWAAILAAVLMGGGAPGADKESNWLSAPADGFNVALRLYWPKESVLNKTWQPAGLEEVQ